jgi:hypothetical protein
VSLRFRAPLNGFAKKAQHHPQLESELVFTEKNTDLSPQEEPLKL